MCLMGLLFYVSTNPRPLRQVKRENSTSALFCVTSVLGTPRKENVEVQEKKTVVSGSGVGIRRRLLVVS